VPKDRRYAAITFDFDSGLYVAGALHDTVFMNFDEDGQPVFVNDCTSSSLLRPRNELTLPRCAAPELVEPRNYRSNLELIMPGTWEAIHGCVLELCSTLRLSVDLSLLARYEFRPNEFISTLKTVSLATRSTKSGRKDFIAVGTTVYRAEDLAARGGVSRDEPVCFGDAHELTFSLSPHLPDLPL
jgi:cleavage and polyadenylation specificity factor subunit 1